MEQYIGILATISGESPNPNHNLRQATFPSISTIRGPDTGCMIRILDNTIDQDSSITIPRSSSNLTPLRLFLNNYLAFMQFSSDKLIKAFRLQSAYYIQPPVRASDRPSQFLASKKIITDVGSGCEPYIVGECGILGPGSVGKSRP